MNLKYSMEKHFFELIENYTNSKRSFDNTFFGSFFIKKEQCLEPV